MIRPDALQHCARSSVHLHLRGRQLVDEALLKDECPRLEALADEVTLLPQLATHNDFVALEDVTALALITPERDPIPTACIGMWRDDSEVSLLDKRVEPVPRSTVAFRRYHQAKGHRAVFHGRMTCQHCVASILLPAREDHGRRWPKDSEPLSR